MNNEEAIEYLKNYKYDNEVRQAIDTVLIYIEELEKIKKYINKNYVSKQKIRELKEKIHNVLDNNGITRAYQIKIDEYFEELLGE